MKNGKFVGQYTRLMTTEEKQKFMDILNAAFSEMGVKVKSIEVSADGSHNSYYGHSSTTFTVTLPQTIAFRKGRDTVYRLTNIKFMVQPELGFNTYAELQEYQQKHGQRGFGADDFNSFEWSVHIMTDGRYHEYRRQYRNDCIYEGENHYFYDTEMPGFYNDIVGYLGRNIPPTSKWK